MDTMTPILWVLVILGHFWIGLATVNYFIDNLSRRKYFLMVIGGYITFIITIGGMIIEWLRDKEYWNKEIKP